MTPSLRWYLLAAPPPAGAAAVLLRGPPPAPAGDPLLMALLVALGAIAANFPVMVAPRYKTDAAPAIDLPFVILFPPATAVALVGLSRILGDGILCLRRNPVTRIPRRAPIDLVFNTSQLMIAAAAAAVVFRGLASPFGQVASAGGAAIVLYVVSTSLVVVAASRINARSAFEIWVEGASVELK